MGAGEDTSDKGNEAAELLEPAVERSSPDIDDVVVFIELIELTEHTPESLLSSIFRLQKM